MDLGIGSPRAGTLFDGVGPGANRTCARMCLADRRLKAKEDRSFLVRFVETFTDVEGRQGGEDQRLDCTRKKAQKHHR